MDRPYARSILGLLCGFACASVIGCVGSEAPDACAYRSAQSLVNGSAGATFLAISRDQESAIGRVWPSGAPPGYFCTGVLIGPSWVLTARHCDWGGGFEFEPGARPMLEQRMASVATMTSDRHDVMLFKLQGPVPGAPIGLLQDDLDATWIGARLQLAGYGARENGAPSPELMFLVEPVTQVTDEVVVLDGMGRSGACVGDSGGPILTRGTDGRIAVAGILTSGSASCIDFDKYVRADVLRSWADSYTAAGGVPQPESCGDVDAVGLCRRGIAIWCDDGVLVSQECIGAQSCGWSEASSGFRCVHSGDDACSGIDDLGVCTADAVRRCNLGNIEEVPCTGCGANCAVDPATGRATCSTAQ